VRACSRYGTTAFRHPRGYSLVALDPGRGFHIHTRRPLARGLGHAEEWLVGIPKASIEFFAGTGNPFSLGPPSPSEHVVDVGNGAGLGSRIAARRVARAGWVVGVDMTPVMIEKATRAAEASRVGNVEFRLGYAEAFNDCRQGRRRRFWAGWSACWVCPRGLERATSSCATQARLLQLIAPYRFRRKCCPGLGILTAYGPGAITLRSD